MQSPPASFSLRMFLQTHVKRQLVLRWRRWQTCQILEQNARIRSIASCRWLYRSPSTIAFRLSILCKRFHTVVPFLLLLACKLRTPISCRWFYTAELFLLLLACILDVNFFSVTLFNFGLYIFCNVHILWLTLHLSLISMTLTCIFLTSMTCRVGDF